MLVGKAWQVNCFGNVFRLALKESRSGGGVEGIISERKWKVTHVEGLKTEKVWELTVESLEVESTRSRVESMGGCVKLKMVIEMR